MLIVLTVPAYAKDDRLKLHKTDFIFQESNYRLVSLETDPEAWDGRRLSDEEYERRKNVDIYLRQIQSFLAETHKANGKDTDRGGVDQLILESFEKFPDPLGQLQFSDAGRLRHRIDDYLERKSIILAVYRQEPDGKWVIFGTVKFVASDKNRLNSPLLSELRGFIPLPMVSTTSEDDTLDIEYENLAKRSGNYPSPVKAMLRFAVGSNFFKFILKNKPGEISLNAEVGLQSYHQQFGFKKVDGFYEGLPAVRMKMAIEPYVQYIEDMTSKLKDSDLVISNLKSGNAKMAARDCRKLLAGH